MTFECEWYWSDPLGAISNFNGETFYVQVLGSPFKVMKILSEYFGYIVPVCPIDGEKKTDLNIFEAKSNTR